MLRMNGINPDIFKASFSAREAAKQLILLEDHLAHPSKRCPDCIDKHKLAAEAFAEEACTLDGADSMPWVQSLGDRIRSSCGADDVRSVRKEIVARLNGSLSGTAVTENETNWPILVGLALAAWFFWKKT